MLQTVVRIPHEFRDRLVFGWNWEAGLAGWSWAAALVLALVALTGIGAWLKPTLRKEALNSLPMLLVITGLAIWLLPFVEERGPEGMRLGLPIRGYGVMLVLAIVLGFGLSLYRARRMGVDPDRVLTMLVGMVIFGIAGARLFHVIQYWRTIYDPESIANTVAQMVRFNEGGLVVYGSLIAGLAWVVWFSRREGWPLFRTGDVIAPGMMLGLAIGRIGCLLNGCCHGGVCEDSWPALRFPQGSVPYMVQLHDGPLLGMELREQGNRVVVSRVEEGSAAAERGVIEGSRVLTMPRDEHLLKSKLLKDEMDLVQVSTPGANAKWKLADLPSRSLPTRPAQVFSAINAAMICLLLLAVHPYRRRDGQLVLLMLTMYAITRFILEMVRTDEGGQFGTALTISQWVSIVMISLAVAGWIYNAKRGELADA